MSQSRKEILTKNFERFDFYIEKADNKASFLLAFSGALIGGILLETDKIININCKLLSIHLVIFTLISLLVSVVYSLLVIIPRIPKMGIESIMFFKSVQDLTLDEYKCKINNLNNDDKLLNEYENETYELAKICYKKMKNMKKSLIFLTISIIFIVIIIFIKIL